MNQRCFFTSLILLSLFLAPSAVSAQFYTISGKITNARLEPLALVSVKVRDLPTGVVSDENGHYSLKLEEGKYDLVFTMIGYKPQVITLVIHGNEQQNILMEEDAGQDLSEVIVKGKAKDRSEEIIRNVIRHKDQLMAAPGAYSLDAYIRAVQEDSTQRKGRKKKNALPDSVVNRNPNADLLRMSMAEISLHYEQGAPGRYREERKGVAKRGDAESLFFLSLTEGDFNLYNNLMKAPALAAVPFLSPVSYPGIAAYRYKMMHITTEGNRKLYTISVRPRQLSNVTVEGEITIMDSAWVVTAAHFSLPSYHLPEYDHFEIDQRYSFVDSVAWMISRQQFTYYSKSSAGKLSGTTTVSYNHFECNKTFPPRYFGPEKSSATLEAYNRDSLFWEQSRTEPLTAKEIRFIHYKDSVRRVVTSKPYLDSMDRLTNSINWRKLLMTGITRFDREKERTMSFPPLTSVWNPFEFGGSRFQLQGSLFKTYKSKKNISVFASVSYGFRNHDVNGTFSLRRMYNPFNRGYYSVGIDRDFTQIFEGDAWINQLKRSNYYLNQAFQLEHGLELFNGFFVSTNLDFAFRKSVAGYKTNPRIDSLFGNILDDNQAIAFSAYNALYGGLKFQYTPGQQYIREPRQKIILGSKWPTFYTSWRKGIPGPFNSKVDFDYWEVGIAQELKLGVTGVSRYTIKSGTFLNKRDLRLVDYKFQRRGDPILFMNPQDAFQSLDSTFPVFNRFYQAHYVHEFNGAILNKIPFLKKLELREIAGGGFLYASERKLKYGELFAGVERVFRWPFDPSYKFKLGVYVVGSAANQFRNPVQFKIGITTWDRRRNRWN